MFSYFLPTTEELKSVYYPSDNPQIWNKPAGINFVAITCIGGGGGGGSGQANSSGVARTGGGGGGGAGITKAIYPAFVIPETIHVVVGAGGRGGSGHIGAGVNGGESYVTAWGALNDAALKLCAAPGGLAANGIVNATAVSAFSSTNCVLSAYAITTFVGGPRGAAGGIGNNKGDDIQALDGSMVTGGAGGGGATSTSTNGGSILTRGPAPAVSGGTSAITASPSIPPWAAQSGYTFQKPMLFSVGGGGGTGVNINAGGYGGTGGIGSGGGGGGASLISAPDGVAVAGSGGSGLVIIECW